MLRAPRLCAVLFGLACVFTSSQSVQADYYDIGPRFAIGFGNNATEAINDAYDQMDAIIAEEEANLPPGHVLVVPIIDDFGFIATNVYQIEFHLVVDPDGGPGGGGGGPGGNGNQP